MRAVSQSAQNQQAVPAPAPAPVGDSTAEPPQDPQVAAAVAARAKLERLLAAPAPFADDDGSISPEVRKALEAVDLPRHQYLDELWAALVGGRLIVPVAAHALPGRFEGSLAQSAGLPHGPSGDGATQVPAHEVHTADACQDAATLAVDLPDGHIALPVFTSAEAMNQWRSDVRPVPVSPQRAAQVACLSTDQLWVLDPGSRDLRLPRPAVVALAGGEEWVPSWRNEPVQAEVRAQLQEVDGVTGVAFGPGESAELRVFIRIDAAGGRAVVARSLEGCQHVMVNPAWGDLIDTVELCPLPA
ncbi:hypothetical protein HMPREF0059_00037 [Actinomyces viscosus C505]|uniref:SseB protein N-terminal domain-containing protein n=1 Tax=Actinomyces viscosus C505 TaxID=562973 RepID=F2UUE0_ACTVI|nr:SseB family protein [Actinomyces viscosus]EGE38693.1 hypothetical protein HMPREF0059_00037 [Actinomyces viscosus C505]